jgi:hypothetical protein
MSVANPGLSQRVKGQEVSILITVASILQTTLVDIQNFELEGQFEVKSQGYLGEKTNRKDDIYNGCKFSMELHLHTEDWFAFQAQMKARAQRLNPTIVFNITAVLSFPNGQTPAVLIPDVKFGGNPMTISSRGDYVKIKLEGEADDFSYTP